MHRLAVESLEDRKLLAFTIDIGGRGFDYATEVARTPDGDVVVAGLFSGTVSFDPIGGSAAATLTSVGTSDIFVAKYDASGNFAWARRFGGLEGDFEIEDDPDRAVDVAINPQRSGGELFVNRPGPQPWDAGEYVNGLAVGPNGEVYFTGGFRGLADFNPDPAASRNLVTEDRDYHDCFVAKLTPAGNLIWANQFGGRFTDIGNDIALDPVGNPYITGLFTRAADFNPSRARFTVPARGRADAFVLKLSVNGKLIWVSALGGEGTERPEGDSGNGIAVDAAGNAYVTGLFAFDADFDPRPGFNQQTILRAFDLTDAFTAKLNGGDGTLAWAQRMGGEGFDGGGSIALIGSPDAPDVVTASYFEEDVTLRIGSADATISATTDREDRTPFYSDLLITRHDGATGATRWARPLGGPFWETIGQLVVNDSGNIALTGGFTGSIDFDPSRARFPLTSINSPFEIRDGNERGGDRFASYDGFITILTAGGGFVHADAFGGTDDDFGIGLAPRATLGSSGELPNTFVLAGRFGGTASFPRAGGDVARTALGRADAFVSFFDTLGVFADDE